MNGTVISDSTKPNFFTLSPDVTGSFMQAMMSTMERVFNVQNNYNIAATDYTNYAIAYSCQTIRRGCTAWLMTRSRTVDQAYLESLYDIATSIGISKSGFQQTNQVGCTN
jgi:lipocalin